MRLFLRLLIRNPIAATLAAAVMVFSGVYSALHMPVDLFPNLEVPVVNIITHYPGASPRDIELLISRPVEDQMRSTPGVKRVASTSSQGISRVTVEFCWGTTVRDARQLVQAKLARLEGILPTGVIPRLENIGTTLQEVAGYVVFGDADPITLRSIVRHDVAGRLMGVEGVSAVEVLGGDRRAFYVEIRSEALASFHLSVNEIAAILKGDNLAAVAGYLDRAAQEYLVRGDARLRTLGDIRSIPAVNEGERSVLIGSIAHVYEGRAPRHYVVHGDGSPAIALIVRKQPGASTVRVVAGVEKAMSSLHRLLPPGTRVKKYYDQSEIIREAQDEILHDLLIGAVLAILVLYFFLGSLRPTVIVAVIIPITLLATVAIMRWFGLSLNVITMAALVLAIGMIVDDAIVVAENIYRRGLNRVDREEASIEGTVEIAGPDTSGTFTTIAAFLPLILAPGFAALFLRPFGLTLNAALIVSLLLSLTLVPVLFSRGSFGLYRGGGFLGGRLLGLLNGGLQFILRFCFRHKWLPSVLAILFLGMAGLAVFLGKATLLPPIDEGAILIEYVMPPGTSLAESNRIGNTLERIALAYPSVSTVYRRTGSPRSSFQVEGVNRGEIMVKLMPKTRRRRSLNQIMAALRKAYAKFNGVVFLYHQPTQEKIDESFSGLPALFGVTLYGTDMNTLVSLAKRVENVLSKDAAVANVVNNTKLKAPQVDVRVDYMKMARYGVRTEDVLTTLQAIRPGLEATRIIRQKEDIGVLVKVDLGASPGLTRIGQLPIVTGSGGMVPLDRIANVRISHAPSMITRLNGQREITVLAEVKGNIPSVVSRLRGKFESIKLPEGYSIEFSGQYRVLVKAAMELAFALVAAAVLIYLIMAMQFRSWLQPLVILFTIPLTLVGGLVALFVSRGSLDVSVGMGAVTLAGIAVNNAIVLMDYANRKSASGWSIQEALLSAASVRFRPILLTSLTTIFALIPAAIGTTAGSEVFRPFAITVIGGLVVGIFATLVIVPVLWAAVSPKSQIRKSSLDQGETRQ